MREKIETIVKKAIVEINEDLEETEQVSYAADTALFGKGKGIDSFSFVGLIANIEDQIAEEFGKEVYLVNNKVFEGSSNPFETVGTLEDYIDTVLKEEV